jgi:hypothetical protein
MHDPSVHGACNKQGPSRLFFAVGGVISGLKGIVLGTCMRVHAWYLQQSSTDCPLLGLRQQSLGGSSALVVLLGRVARRVDAHVLKAYPYLATGTLHMLAVSGARGPFSQLN